MRKSLRPQTHRQLTVTIDDENDDNPVYIVDKPTIYPAHEATLIDPPEPAYAEFSSVYRQDDTECKRVHDDEILRKIEERLVEEHLN